MVCGGKLAPKSMRVESPYRKYRIGQAFGIHLEHMARRSKVCTCTVNFYKFYVICKSWYIMVKRRKAEIYDHTGRVPPTAPMLSLQRMFAKLQISAPGPVTGFHR